MGNPVNDKTIASHHGYMGAPDRDRLSDRLSLGNNNCLLIHTKRWRRLQTTAAKISNKVLLMSKSLKTKTTSDCLSSCLQSASWCLLQHSGKCFYWILQILIFEVDMLRAVDFFLVTSVRRTLFISMVVVVQLHVPPSSPRDQPGGGLLRRRGVRSRQRVRLFLQRPRQDCASSADCVLHRGGACASGELRGVDEAGAAVALPQDPAVPASSAPHWGHPHHEGGGRRRRRRYY